MATRQTRFMKAWTSSSPFEQSLRSRTFEPDGPNYTPRISGIMHIENGTYNYAMSNFERATMVIRRVHTAIPLHMRIQQQERDILSIHTSVMVIHFQAFEGEPKLVSIPDDMEAFTDLVWNSLNADNKVSHFCALY